MFVLQKTFSPRINLKDKCKQGSYLPVCIHLHIPVLSCSHTVHSGFHLFLHHVFLIQSGTISVVYLIVLVTLKAIRLGFHLEFHWFEPTKAFVPGI